MARVFKKVPTQNVLGEETYDLRTFEIAKHLERGGAVPPIHVICGGGSLYWMPGDGRHRLAAHRMLRKKHILVRFYEENVHA